MNALAIKTESVRGALERAQMELVQVLNRKAYKVDVTKSLQQKADKETLSSMNDLLAEKATKAEVDLQIKNRNTFEEELRDTFNR